MKWNEKSLRPWPGVDGWNKNIPADLNVSGDIETVATNHINKFPTADSAFSNDFSLLPKFVSEYTFDEFASYKSRRLLPFVHDVQVTTDNLEEYIIYRRAL